MSVGLEPRVDVDQCGSVGPVAHQRRRHDCCDPVCSAAVERVTMIQVQHLTKTYEDPDGGEIVAVADASLSCAAGQIYGLLGPNGAGKTTTLRCLATVLTPTAGTATIAGHDLIKEPEAVRRSIGFLSASTGLYARLTPRETLTFFGSLHGLKGEELEGRVDEVIGL